MNSRAILSAAVLAALLAACAGEAPVPAAPPAVTPSPPPTATAAPTTPAAVGDSGAPTFGKPVPLHAGTVAVHAFQGDVKLSPPDGEGKWAGVDAEFCYTTQTTDDLGNPLRAVGLSWEPWSLADGENRRFPAFSSGSHDSWPTPTYPQFGEPLDLGECARGWILFPLPDNASPTTIRYRNSYDPAVTWTR